MNGKEVLNMVLTIGPFSPFSPRGPLLPGAPWKSQRVIELLLTQLSRNLLTQPLIINPNVAFDLPITIYADKVIKRSNFYTNYRINVCL